LSSIKLRNWKKALALISVFALFFQIFVVNVPASNAETVTIYHETFADGAGAAVQSGGASLTQVTGKVFEGNSDGTALYVNNRSHDYDAADFNFGALGLENGKTYAITVKGYVDSNAIVPSGAQAWLQTISSYGWLGGVNFTTGAAFTLSGNYTVDTSKDTKIRIQSNAAGATVPFYIGDIIITGESTSTTPENQVYHETFTSGTGAAVQSGSASLTKVTGKVFDGNTDGNALYISNRSNTWDAADFKFTDLKMENGKTYTITVKGYVDSNVPVTSGAGAALQTDKTYAFLAGANFVTGNAFTLTKKYTVNSTTDTSIRIQSNEAGKTVPFYIGDILVTGESTGPVTVFHETFTTGTGIAVQSGGASLTKITGKVFEGNADGNALYVSNRANTWDAADFKFVDLKMANGKTYTITVKGYVDSNVPVTSGAGAALQTDKTYAFLTSANFVTGSAFTLTKEYTVNSTTDTAIRIQSNEAGKTVPFYIGDILITENEATAITRPPAADFTTITFEDQTKGDFAGRAGTETLTVTNETNHTSGGAYSLKVEGRTSTWHGPSLHVEKYIDQGSEYIITAWVKLISPASSQLQLSTQIGNGNSANYVTLQAKTISTSDGWVKYEGTYRYNNASSEYLTIYVESSSNATASFYIDDVSFEPTGSGTVEIQDLTPIKDVYSSDFLIGNAISSEDLSGVRLELLKKHFNIATAGNAMKPDALQPTKGNFTFTAADALVDKVLAEGLQMHGHVLVWHQQSPAWLNTTGSGIALGRDEALTNLRTHIQTVMNHFGNKVISWDVVNEAMNDNPTNPSDWKASLRKTPWYNAIGDDYIEQAFLAAREVLDAHPSWNIRLYYNDYNEDNQNKSKAIYNMVKELNDRYAQTHPGKLLIDGLGMQAHYNLSTNPANVKLSLERFLSLGVKVSITELDIQAGSNSTLPVNLANAQGYLYAQLFTIFKEHAADIERVTIWGMDDGTSWRSTTNPLLFDKNLQAKPAYYAVTDPATFMDENAPETPANAKQSTAQYGTPVIDGAVDAIWSNTPTLQVNQYQMAWQGATGTAKVLWDDSGLYILFQVSDTELDKSSTNPWEQDSVEAFLDENNGKTSFYQDDDGQYRVNFDNELTYNLGGATTSFVSATTTSAGASYTVEMNIPFKTITPANNVKIGFDAQINDGKGGARQSAATWNDITGQGYQDTSVYGVLTLTGKGASNPNTSVDSNSGSSIPAPAVTTTPVPTASTVTMQPILSGSTGTVKLDDAKAKDLLSKNITISVPAIAGATAYAVGLPVTALTGAQGGGTLTLSTNAGTIAIPANMLTGIASISGKEASVTIGQGNKADLSADVKAALGNRPLVQLSLSVDGKQTDWNNPNAPVTVSIPYTPTQEEMKNPENIVVWYIDGSGKVVTVPNGRYDIKTGMVTFDTTHFSLYAVSFVQKSFSDLGGVAWAKKSIEVLAAKDIVKTPTATTYNPSANITRADFLYSLVRSLGVNAKTDGNFDDVSKDAYYYNEIAIAKVSGITAGLGNNKFGPDSSISRQDMMVMTERALKLLKKVNLQSAASVLDKFTDKKSVASYAANSVATIVKEGLIVGNSNKINPTGNTTRAEAAVFLYRIYNKY
jgi:endo-1,4-beta-xylanase